MSTLGEAWAFGRLGEGNLQDRAPLGLESHELSFVIVRCSKQKLKHKHEINAWRTRSRGSGTY